MTIAVLGTAMGTLVLGGATFASVRSANRAARVAERSLLLGLRPVLTPARPGDLEQDVVFRDGRVFRVGSGASLVLVDGDVIYFAIPLRNVGAGLAVLQRFYVHPENLLRDPNFIDEQGLFDWRRRDRPDLGTFRKQLRDLYVPSGDIGFWQTALRDPTEELHKTLTERLAGEPSPVAVDLYYGDHEGGQHAITRFYLAPDAEGVWRSSVIFHWILEGGDPRELG